MSSKLLAFTTLFTAVIFLLPVALGLAGTLLPGFGFFPALGFTEFSFDPWRELFQYPGASRALQHTLVSGIGASILALIITLVILIGGYPSRMFLGVERHLSFLLSVPHAAFAIGIGLLIMPSGWLFRAVHAVTGLLPVPANLITFQDPQGISLMLVLALKEVPFLLLMSLAALPGLHVQKTLWLGKSMQRSSRFIWLFVLLPQLYQRIRLPFYAVIAYSLTVVDVALIAGPTTPPTLAVLTTQLFNDPNLSLRLPASSSALLLLLITLLVLLSLRLIEHWLSVFRSPLMRVFARSANGRKTWEQFAAPVLGYGILAVYALSLLVTLVWSFATRWRYPDMLPSTFSLRSWNRIFTDIGDPLWCTLLLGLLAASIALVLTIIALENEVRRKYQQQSVNTQRILWLIYIPLIVPQIAFLFGFQVFLLSSQLSGLFVSLLWSHLVFVFPYVFLTLSGSYRKFDDRYYWQAITLSGKKRLAFWRIKLPMLIRPILFAFATGFAVSVSQYLATLFVGMGKYTTLTTEAVALASGSDRRVMSAMAVVQQLLPLIIFAAAIFYPKWRFKRRPSMQHATSV